MHEMGHPPPSPAPSMGNPTALDQQQPSVNTSNYTRSYFEHQHHARAAQQAGDVSAHRLACGYPNNDAHMPSYDKPDDFSAELYAATAYKGNLQHTHMTPPTPPPAEDSITTRSGLGIRIEAHNSETPPVMASGTDVMGEQQQSKRRSKRRAAKRGEPCMLEKPLSELAKEEPAASIVDIVAFVHRSISVRQREQPQASLKIKRPLNAFLLYRKAFGPFARKQLQRILGLKEEPKDQQLVSRLCGQSWVMETASIKNKFKGILAETEKTKHIQAFPDYKYTPKTVKKQKEDEIDSPKRALGMAKPLSSANAAMGPGGVTPSFSFNDLDHFGFGGSFEPQAMVDPSSQAYWPASASGGPYTSAPGLYGHNGYTDFYQPGLDLYPMPSDFMYGEGAGSGTAAGSYLAPQAYTNTSLTMDSGFGGNPTSTPSELCIDPSLLPGAGAGDAGFEWSSKSHAPSGSWRLPQAGRISMFPSMPDLDADGAHNAYLMGGPDDWQVEPLDEVSHFNDWMAQDDPLGGI